MLRILNPLRVWNVCPEKPTQKQVPDIWYPGSGGSRYELVKFQWVKPFNNWHEITFFPKMIVNTCNLDFNNELRLHFIYMSLPFMIYLQYTKSTICWHHVVVDQNNHDPRDEQNPPKFATLFVAMRNFDYIPTRKNIDHPGKWRFTHDGFAIRIYIYISKEINLRVGLHSDISLPSLKLTACTWKWMVGILVSFWDGVFSGAMLVSGSVKVIMP